MPEPEPLLSVMLNVEQVSGLLSVPVSWVYSAAERGELPSYKLGRYRRFSQREFNEWLQARRAVAPAGKA